MKIDIKRNPLYQIPAYALLVIAGYFLLFGGFTILPFGILSAYFTYFLYLLSISFLFTFKFSPIRLNFSFKQCTFYACLALSAMIIMTIINVLIGGEINFQTFSLNLLSFTFYLIFFQSIIEEVVFRGVIFNLINTKYNLYISLFVSSILFAFVHIDNFSISYLALLNIFLAGVLLGLIFYKTQSILNAISFHFFWNFTQSYLFGVAVSGLESSESIFSTKIIESKISNLIIGNEFGYESGLTCTIILLCFSYYIFKLNNKKVTKQ